MEDTISRKAVLMLVILALVISVLSTTMVLNAVSHLPSAPAPQGQGSSLGVVQFTVPQPPPTARVTFEVKEPGEAQ